MVKAMARNAGALVAIGLAALLWSAPCDVALAQISDELDGMFQASVQLKHEGRYNEAISIAQQLVRETAATEGTGHDGYATAIENLALLYHDVGRMTEAEPLLRQSLEIRLQQLGPDHEHVGMSYINLGRLYKQQNLRAKAEEHFRAAVALYERTNGKDSPILAVVLNNLSSLNINAGRYSEAEPFSRRAVEILEKAPGQDALLASALVNLGIVFKGHNRLDEAEGLYKRAISLFEKPDAQDIKNSAVAYHALGILYIEQQRWAETEASFEKYLALSRAMFGRTHHAVADGLSALGRAYQGQGRFRDAEKKYKEAREMFRRTGFIGSADGEFYRIATLYMEEGQYAKAEPIIKKLLPKMTEAKIESDPLMAETLRYLGVIEGARGNWAKATNHFRQSGSIWLNLPSSPTGVQLLDTRDGSRFRQSLLDLKNALFKLSLEPESDRAALTEEGFEAVQRAAQSSSGTALTQMTARLARGDTAIGMLVREFQDLASQWAALDKRLADARGGAASEQEAVAAKAELARVDARIREIGATLARDFPEFSQYSKPEPMSIKETQSLLGTDEVLLVYHVSGKETFLWVVTKTDSRWVRSEVGTPLLQREVTALRCGLDFEGAWGSKESRCRELLKPTYTLDDYNAGKPLPYDPARAHGLYKALFGGIEDLIKDKHLLIVPSGPLTQLPFQVLVTADPGAGPRPPDGRGSMAETDAVVLTPSTAWLIRQHAITVLPAVSSLKALRQGAKASQAAKPFAGVGNPLLDGPDRSYDAAKQAALNNKNCGTLGKIQVAEARGGGVRPVFLRGGIANVADLRRAPPLPETAEELCGVAKSIGAGEDDVLLGSRASESEIKRLSDQGLLKGFRILHFATHGALAGEASGSNEPGLLLTPPSGQGTEADDGYLSASEIAGLKVDADWVILSACNTAGGEKVEGSSESAEALSGLARAFFYAGARSLLVSHWYIDSRATVALITSAFAEMKGQPQIGRAEAMRQSMLKLANSADNRLAHPSAWAPFIVVGEGAAAQ